MFDLYATLLVPAGYRDVSPSQIWQYLHSMYDMDVLGRIHSEESEDEEDDVVEGSEVEGGGEAGGGGKEEMVGGGDLKEFEDFVLPKYILQPESRKAKDEAAKRPTRSTPGVTPNKRRK